MGQRTLHWLRPFRPRQQRKQSQQQSSGSTPSSPPHTPPLSPFIPSRRSSSNNDFTKTNQPSVLLPDPSYPVPPPDQPNTIYKPSRRHRKSPSPPMSTPSSHPPLHPSSQPRNSTTSIDTPPNPSCSFLHPNPPTHSQQSVTFDFARLQTQTIPHDFADQHPSNSMDFSTPGSAATVLDNFIPHRPADREPAFVPPLASDLAAHAQMRFSATTPEVSSVDRIIFSHGFGVQHASNPDQPPHGQYHTTMPTTQPSRFAFRRRIRSNHAAPHPSVHPHDDYFGATQHDDAPVNNELGQGEEVLLRFLRKTLGPRSENLAVRLMNKTPITSTTTFNYTIHQGTEDSDLDIIRRDLISGRLYTSGVRLIAGGWSNLLLGDRFTPNPSTRQRHELTYKRSACSCINCRVRAVETLRGQRVRNGESDLDSNAYSAEILSNMSSSSRTPTHSAMANFVVKTRLPSLDALKLIGASSSSRELEIGTVVRLNYRASAKLKFTNDVKELFGHFAYTGPISHEEVYRRVTTIGVHYYLYNKGKKERKVYIQGELIRLPVQVGVVKLGTQPMYFDELGATFCLHRKQIMSIYVGEIVLEGNSLGSFIKTGISYYIGFGEERGVCAVYPNKSVGKARKLGINELLLHHHMVDDLEVRCI